MSECNCSNIRKRPIVVLFSGGYDSTHLIFKSLHEGHEVIAITIEADMTGDFKLAKEREAIKQLTPILEAYARDHDTTIRFEALEVSAFTGESKSFSFDNANSKYSKGNAIVQPVFWLCNALPLVVDNAEIALGYISGDRSLSKLSYMEQLVEAAARIMDKRFTITTPLVDFDKSDILRGLYSIDPGIIDICYSCESLYMARCGKCHSCQCLRNALMELCIATSTDTEQANFWRQRLTEWFGYDVHSAEVAKNSIHSYYCVCDVCGKPFRSEYEGLRVCEDCAEIINKYENLLAKEREDSGNN